jgi:hypothetical protein
MASILTAKFERYVTRNHSISPGMRIAFHFVDIMAYIDKSSTGVPMKKYNLGIIGAGMYGKVLRFS